MNYPLLFTFRDVVSGNGYLAGVTLYGQLLMVLEDDQKWWAYGVRPAGIAAPGSTPQEAHFNFRNRYKEVLFDIAEESADFESFRKEVERFYNESDNEEQERWLSAFQAIRSGAVVAEPFSSLPQEAPETRPTGVALVHLNREVPRYNPTDNVPDLFATAA